MTSSFELVIFYSTIHHIFITNIRYDIHIKYKRRKDFNMENQYSYYHPDDQNNQRENTQYAGEGFQSRPPYEKKPRKKMPKAMAVIGFALLFGVVSSATFITSNFIGNKVLGLDGANKKAEDTDIKVSGTNLNKTSSVITSDVSDVVKDVMPSLVSITNMSIQEVQSFFGGYQQQKTESAGSGLIVSKTDNELLMVTNNHVVEGSQTLTVTFADETSLEANIKGTDAKHDLAVISVPLSEIPEETMNAIAVATLGDSTKLSIGEPASAIGNALGYGQSVTTGVISAVNRESTTVDETTGEKVGDGVKLIQTDAAINPGNSGGALLNARGEVIGINSSKLAGTAVEGMGYAIPVSDVSDIIADLMNRETKTRVPEAKRGYLGISGFDVDPQSAERYHMPVGVYVEEVISGGGAEAAGITKGNIITGVEDANIDDMESLQRELEYYAAGDTISVSIQIPENNGEYTEKEVEVTLGKRVK